MKTQNKIRSRDGAVQMMRHWKSEGKSVVFTNGCFDLLHLGHVDYLERARELGDCLIVGINTDSSVSRIKGPDRPITDQESRSRIMAGLEFVDMVVFFDESTPLELISELKPDVLVKGNDYLAENIVGAEIVKANGGKVLTIPLLEGYSTSNIVEKIKR